MLFVVLKWLIKHFLQTFLMYLQRIKLPRTIKLLLIRMVQKAATKCNLLNKNWYTPYVDNIIYAKILSLLLSIDSTVKPHLMLFQYYMTVYIVDVVESIFSGMRWLRKVWKSMEACMARAKQGCWHKWIQCWCQWNWIG